MRPSNMQPLTAHAEDTLSAYGPARSRIKGTLRGARGGPLDVSKGARRDVQVRLGQLREVQRALSVVGYTPEYSFGYMTARVKRQKPGSVS